MPATTAPSLESHTIQRPEGARSYLLASPVTRHTPCALVIALHGAGGTARLLARESGLTETAAREGFAVAFPEASRPAMDRPPQFERNPQTWNDGSGRFHSGERNIDDIGCLDAVIDDVCARHTIDHARIYMVGISNGCAMTLRYAVERGERLVAIAGVAGFLSVPVERLTHPRSLLYIVGTADPVTPLHGGDVTLPWGSLGYRPPPRQTVERWAALLECPPTPTRDTSQPGITREHFGPGRNGCTAELITVDGMGHVWPGGRPHLPEQLVGPAAPRVPGNTLLWTFLSLHDRR